MSGYVYALRPVDIPLVKIGFTTNPDQRAQMLASFSPFPVEYTYLRDVGTKRRAIVWEHYVHALTAEFASHGEWRRDAPEVYDVLSDVEGSDVDLGGTYRQAPTTRKPICRDYVDFRLFTADIEDRFSPGCWFSDATGLPMNWQTQAINNPALRAKYRAKLEAYLAANPTARAS